ncbi:MAG: hypothetical protein ACRD96_27395, partial [Bryobacteraceae bacterium]
GQTGQTPNPPAPETESEYAGPAILSRGASSVFRTPQSLKLRPFVTLNGVHETGITGVTVQPDGSVPDDSSWGAEAIVGAYGYQRLRRGVIGLDYKGNYRHYSRNSYYNGTDQLLALVVSRQASKRVSFTLRESAGTFSRSFQDYFDGFGDLDPSFANVPASELFDGRTNYLSTLGDLTYAQSARLSFNMGGDGFLVRRRSKALFGVTGYRARGDVNYRASRRTTMGVHYSFTHYEYTKAFGASDFHTVSYNHSIRIGRRAELGLQVGGARVETLGIARVAIDPVIAAILGQTYGVQALYRVNYVPVLGARISQGFRTSHVSVSYHQAPNSGNGVYLTSRHQTARADYSYTGIRRWHFGASGGYNYLGSLTQTLGSLRGWEGGAGANYQLGAGMHITTRADFRRHKIGQTTFERTQTHLTVGFSFSPGEVPLSFWR